MNYYEIYVGCAAAVGGWYIAVYKQAAYAIAVDVDCVAPAEVIVC